MTNYKSIKYNISGADLTGLTASQIPNLDTAKVTTGTFADARVSASSVTAHVDLTPVRQDVLTLALKQAIQENSTKFNLPNSAITKFEADADFNLAGSTTVSRNASEYISSAVLATTNTAITLNSSNYTTYIDVTKASNIKVTTSSPARQGNDRYNPELDSNVSLHQNSTYIASTLPNAAQEEVLLGYYFGNNSSDDSLFLWPNDDTSATYRVVHHNMRFKEGTTFTPTHNGDAVFTWRNGSGGLHTSQGFTFWGTLDGGTGENDYTGAILASNSGGLSNGTTYTRTISNSSSVAYDGLIFRVMHADSSNSYMFNNCSLEGTANVEALTTNAAGIALGTTNVPTSAVTDVSGVMLLKNTFGTNTLGTDIKVYFTANNSAFTECTYADAGTFSTGIKMIKLGKTTCTQGSDVRWKVVWANQVASSKVADIYGIGLNY